MYLVARLAAALVVVSACATDAVSRRPGRASDEFVPGVMIPVSDYDVEESLCQERIGQAVVDGETIQERQWVLTGSLRNRLDTWSPHYQLDVSATLSDGTVLEREGTAFPAVPPGESHEFRIFVASASMFEGADVEVVDCDLVVLDSVLNYGE